MIKISAPRAVLAVLLTGTMAAAGIGGAWDYLRKNDPSTHAVASQTSSNDIIPTDISDYGDVIPASGAPTNLAHTNLPAFMAAILPNIPRNSTGDYLISHFAQSQNDWTTASTYLNGVLKKDSDNPELLRRSMVMALGAGDFDLAVQRADQIVQIPGEQDALAYLTLASRAIIDERYDNAIEILNTLPTGDMADFVIPLLSNWAKAGNGAYDKASLESTTMHAYHGGLIAHYLKQDSADITRFAKLILQPDGLTAEEYERAADLFALAGNTDEAKKIYEALQTQSAGSAQIPQKLVTIQQGKPFSDATTLTPINTPADGAAQAVFDLARILFQENSDASARIFSNMALALNPNLAEARIILATSSARSGQYKDALAQFDRIPTTHPTWKESQYAAADMLDQAGQTDEAVRRLRQMYDLHRDVDALSRIGDIYRGHERFDEALVEYNAAIDALGGDVPAEYWYLLYARGMCFEQTDNWDAAEKDLQAALKFQPEQPYLLNYLGYGWADQGKNLDQSLKLIKQALALRPNDGYITDSLGWVHYKFGQYAEAVQHLERAVELLPYDPTINDHLGDAYWAVGRKMEARFQWNRARNYADKDADADLIATVADKLEHGPTPQSKPPIRAASTAKPTDTAQ